MGLFDNIKKKATDLFSKSWDQVNMFDNNRTFEQRTPTNNQSIFQQAKEIGPVNRVIPAATNATRTVYQTPGSIGRSINTAWGGDQAEQEQISRSIDIYNQGFKAYTQQFRSGKITKERYEKLLASLRDPDMAKNDEILGRANDFVDYVPRPLQAPLAGLGRSAVGTGESVSGLYDLVTPGDGINRFTKDLTGRGRTLDEFVKSENLNTAAYKAGQFTGDAATFMLPGMAAEKVMTKIPAVTKYATKLDDFATGPASKAFKYIASPGNVVDIAADTTLSSGFRAGRGEDVSLGTVTMDAAVSTAFSAAMGGSIHAAKLLNDLRNNLINENQFMDAIRQLDANQGGGKNAPKNQAEADAADKPAPKYEDNPERLSTGAHGQKYVALQHEHTPGKYGILNEKTGEYTNFQHLTAKEAMERLNKLNPDYSVTKAPTKGEYTVWDRDGNAIDVVKADSVASARRLVNRFKKNEAFADTYKNKDVDTQLRRAGVKEAPVEAPKTSTPEKPKVTVTKKEPGLIKHGTMTHDKNGSVVMKKSVTVTQTKATPPPKQPKKVNVRKTEPAPEVKLTDKDINKLLKKSQWREFRKAHSDQDSLLLDVARKLDKRDPRAKNDGLTRVEEVMFRTNQQRASDRIANVELDESPEFNAAVNGMKKSEVEDFSVYSNARSELATAKKRGKDYKTSDSRKNLAEIVRAGDRVYGERFDNLSKFYYKRAEEMADAGIISKQKLATFKKNKNYIRMQRDMDELFDTNPGGKGGNSFNMKSTTTTQKRTGSTREALNVLDVAAERNQQIQRELARTKSGATMVNMLREAGLATHIHSSKATHRNTIVTWKDGKKQFYEVPKDIAEAVANVNPYQIQGAMKIVAGIGRLFRATTTGINPAFSLVANPIRDIFSSAIFSKDSIQTHNPNAWVRGVANGTMDAFGMNTNPLYKEFRKIYGDMTSYDLAKNTKSAREAVDRIRGGGAVTVKQKLRHPINTMEDFASISEKATRFQNFQGLYTKYSKTMTHEMAVEKAAIGAWQNSVDFARSGTWGRTLNMIFPYWNPAVQGTRQLARSTKERPFQTGFKSTLLVGVPLIAATAWNMSDPETAEEYKKVPDWEKEGNLIIFPPGSKEYFKVPLPQGIKDVFMPFRRAMESHYSKDPVNAGAIAQDILQVLAGPVQTGSVNQFAGTFVPQAIKPGVQAVFNKDLFTGNEIESKEFDEWGVPNKDRAYKSTSGTAKQIGQMTGWSPIKIEKFLKDTAGEVGLLGLGAVDNIQAAMKGDIKGTPENESDHTIGGRGFVESLKRRLAGTTEDTRSDGAKWYALVDEGQKAVGMDKNDIAAWRGNHPPKKDIVGNVVYESDGLYNAQKRLEMYNDHPKTFAFDKWMDQKNREQGKPGNPIFDLQWDKARKVLEKEAMRPGQKDPELSNLYKEAWFSEYSTKKSQFFKDLKGQIQKDLDTARQEGNTERVASLEKSIGSFNNPKNPYPDTPPELQKVMDGYNKLPKGTGDRSAWIAANPGLWKQMTDQWGKVDAWQNKRRGELGLAPTEGEDGEKKFGSYTYNESDGDSDGYKGYGYSRSGRRGGGGSGGDDIIYDDSAKWMKNYATGGKVTSGQAKSQGKVSVKAKARKRKTGKVTVKSSKIRLA